MGDHLGRVHLNQMVYEMIRLGRVVWQSRSSVEAISLKTRVTGTVHYHSNETAVEAAKRDARGPS
jgi:hypothetical protein